MTKAQAWPADKVERRKVSALVPYARNSRTHSEEQIAQIAASIKEWGWTVPVLIEPDGGIIAGHGRVMAAQKLSIDEVPCMIAEGWSEAQKCAYVIADNKLALNAEWDEDVLRVELDELQGLDFDIGLSGFSDAELSNMNLPANFMPSDELSQGKLDQLSPKAVICPSCHYEFDARDAQA